MFYCKDPFWPKFQTQKLTRTPLSVKYVIGAPGVLTLLRVSRDHRATLRLGGGGTKHFFLLILYDFKKYWGDMCPPVPPTPRSLVSDRFLKITFFSTWPFASRTVLTLWTKLSVLLYWCKSMASMVPIGATLWAPLRSTFSASLLLQIAVTTSKRVGHLFLASLSSVAQLKFCIALNDLSLSTEGLCSWVYLAMFSHSWTISSKCIFFKLVLISHTSHAEAAITAGTRDATAIPSWLISILGIWLQLSLNWKKQVYNNNYLLL